MSKPQDSISDIGDELKSINDKITSDKIGEAVLEGDCGFHAFTADGETPFQQAMYSALYNLVNAPREWEIEEEYGEVTPETARKLMEREIENVCGRHFEQMFLEAYEEALEKAAIDE